MTTAQVVETSVTVNNNSPIQDYIHPDDQTQPTFEMTPGFKPLTNNSVYGQMERMATIPLTCICHMPATETRVLTFFLYSM